MGAGASDIPIVVRAWAILLSMAASLSGANAGDAPAPADAPRAPSRVVHRFDFDERPLGNLEPIPMYWLPFRPEGFPTYTQGEFDYDTGRLAPPSLLLRGQGGSVSLHYTGPDTRVQPDTDYLVEAYIRTADLLNGRAALSAHYLDDRHQVLTGAMVRSPFVGGEEAADWTRVELHLPPAPESAATIGLIAWVVQSPYWQAGAPAPHAIIHTDVEGRAWFDDVTVYAMPRASLATDAPGNVLIEGAAHQMLVSLADRTGLAMEGRLIVTGATGEEVLRHTVTARVNDGGAPQAVPLQGLASGVYQAALYVPRGDPDAPGFLVGTLRFAVVPDLGTRIGTTRPARTFGVVVTQRCTAIEDDLGLLVGAVGRSVKLPIAGWSGPNAAGADDTALVQELVRSGFSPTGVLAGAPRGVGEGADLNLLVDALVGDASAWRPTLSQAVAPHAGAFRWWQVGADGGSDPDVRRAELLPEALEALRREMRPFITAPQLVAPVSARAVATLPGRLPAEQLSVYFDAQSGPGSVAAQVSALRPAGYERLSAFVPPLDTERFETRSRLGDWARKLLRARHAGADVVYAPQPWDARRDGARMIPEPGEEYLVFRTIAALLGTAEPAGELTVADGVTALVFSAEEQAVVALWDSAAPPEGREHLIQLGRADDVVDLLGRATPLTRDSSGRHPVRLTDWPVFVDGVEPWLLALQQGVTLRPQQATLSGQPIPAELELSLPAGASASVDVRFELPEGWRANPASASVTVAGGEPLVLPVELRYPHSEPAGVRPVTLRVRELSAGYYFEAPLNIELGMDQVEVWGSALFEGGSLVLRHVVTNESQATVNFRSTASVPGQERQHRPITSLGPGQTQVVEYRFPGGRVMSGKQASLLLRDLEDTGRFHNLLVTVP